MLHKLPNVFILNEYDSNKFGFDNPNMLTEEELQKCVAVAAREGLSTVNMRNPEDKYIYWIGEKSLLLTQTQFVEYARAHADQNFLIQGDSVARNTGAHHPVAFITSQPNYLEVRLYDVAADYKYKMIGKLVTEPKKAVWKQPIILEPSILVSLDPDATSYYYDAIKLCGIYSTKSQYSNTFSYTSTSSCWISTAKGYQTLELKNFLPRYINIPGTTRITAEVTESGVTFQTSVGERATASILERYGATRGEIRKYYSYSTPSYDDNDVFPNTPLDTETDTRIRQYITECLEKDIKCPDAPGYGNHMFRFKGVTVITQPAPRHQRPTFHYVIGCRDENGNIDIVELVRGELQMQDMQPVSCYLLDHTGKYCRTRNKLYSGLKDLINCKSEVDSISASIWSEEKSLHPELLKAVMNCDVVDQIELPTIKLFNTTPFGALFMEQLIKGKHYVLAQQLAEYIAIRADKFEYVCSSLEDIFPGSNPAGTSIMRVLNLTKPCCDLLFELLGAPITRYDFVRRPGTWANDKFGQYILKFIELYKLIKVYIPSGIVTSENKKILMQYTQLKQRDWVTYTGADSQEISLLDYPQLIKPIYKMVNRLYNDIQPDNQYEATREYREIVQAYVKFLTLGWDPEAYKIFIEFGLSGTDKEKLKELGEREHAANKALKIYEDKINEKAHKENEEHYAFRKSALELLERKDIIVEVGTHKKHYMVMAPTQIYGEDVIGSIEKEGHDMQHCLFRQYADQISNGTYTVVYLREKDHPEQSLVTIGINQNGRINQTYAQNDKQISPEQADAILQWAKSKEGLVTFKSEHAVVNPGGWPYGIGIIQLPSIDHKWLSKLAAIKA